MSEHARALMLLTLACLAVGGALPAEKGGREGAAAPAPGPAFTGDRTKEWAPAVGEAPAAPAALGTLPAGPRPFTVERPAPLGGPVLSVRDFGADPAQEDNTQAFTNAISRCREQKASALVIPKGVYLFLVGQPALLLSGLADFTLDGQGSELVWVNRERRDSRGMLAITNCERIHVRNLVLDWDYSVDPLASLVRVVAVAADARSLDVEFTEYRSFPNRAAGMKVLEAVDPATLSVGCEGKHDVYLPEWYGGRPGENTQWLSDNVARLSGANYRAIQVGDLFRARHYAYGPAAIMIRGGRHISLSGVSVYGVPGMAIVARDRAEYLHIESCTVDRRPGTRRMISCTADHINLGDTLGHVLIEDCNIGWGGDDCINLHNGCSPALKLDSKAVSARLSDHQVRVGDLVEFRGTDLAPLGFRSRIAALGPGTWQSMRVTFEDAFPDGIPAEVVLYNRTIQSGNAIVRRCTFHENRARGVVLEVPDCLIEDCRFYRVQMNALLLNSGFSRDLWSEGQEVANVVVRRNTIEECNKAGIGEKGAQVFMTVYLGRVDTPERKTTYPVFRDILFEGNRFVRCTGGSFFISSARGVTIRGNVLGFKGSAGRGDARDRSRVFVSYASDVRVVDNTWEKSPDVPAPGALVDLRQAEEIVWAGNRLATPGAAR